MLNSRCELQLETNKNVQYYRFSHWHSRQAHKDKIPSAQIHTNAKLKVFVYTQGTSYWPDDITAQLFGHASNHQMDLIRNILHQCLCCIKRDCKLLLAYISYFFALRITRCL